MIVFPLDCLPCFEWWLFPLWPVLAQPWVAGSASFSAYSLFDGSLFNLGLLAVFHMVLVPSVTSPFLALGYWQCFMWCLYPLWPVPFQPWVTGSASCGACSLFDEALFNLGLLAVFHMVLIPSLMSRCSALGYWPRFMWCLYPLWPLTFQPWLLTVLHIVLAPFFTSPFQPWVDIHAPSGLVKFEVNKKLNKNTVLERTSKQCTCKGASKYKCRAFIYYHFSTFFKMVIFVYIFLGYILKTCLLYSNV